ncbi:ricin B lectin domain-containing protein [Flagelloscypha sp. PMI_526]|nr:ricin B lectin domain-containing protein [Flagelloscypha sp. PMI_526]
MKLFDFIGITAVSTVLVTAQTLKACTGGFYIPSGDRYVLTRAAKIDSYLQCDYLHDNGAAGSTGAYCFYRTSDYALSHYPNTPLPLDSNPSCPDPLPDVVNTGKYIITVPTISTALVNCVTLLSAAADGTKVGIKSCDGRHGFPSQLWTFDGYTMKQGNFCLDVPNGNTTNGVKLQVWTCSGGDTNQQFTHPGGDLLYYPNDRFTWAGTNKCVDLTGGSVADSTPLPKSHLTIPSSSPKVPGMNRTEVVFYDWDEPDDPFIVEVTSAHAGISSQHNKPNLL